MTQGFLEFLVFLYFGMTIFFAVLFVLACAERDEYRRQCESIRRELVNKYRGRFSHE